MFTRLLTTIAVLLIAAALPCQVPPDKSAYLPAAKIEHLPTITNLTANFPRPLLQAVDALQGEYGYRGWRIDYEEPPYESKFDLVDDTDPKWRAAHPNDKGVTTLTGGLFESSYDEGNPAEWSPTDLERVLLKVVTDYNQTDNPGRFIVRQETAHRFVIIGIAVTDDAHREKPTAAILDTPISLPGQERNAADTLNLIAQRISAKSAIPVHYAGFGGIADNCAYQSQVTVGEENLPARTLLLQTVEHLACERIWRLTYDHDAKQYALYLTNELKH